jgi:hypothetical protein
MTNPFDVLERRLFDIECSLNDLKFNTRLLTYAIQPDRQKTQVSKPKSTKQKAVKSKEVSNG